MKSHGRCALLGFVIVLAASGVSAAELVPDAVHLGTPPAGFVFVEARSLGTVAPILLAGTLTPPALTSNGQPVPLKEEGPAQGPPGLWVNQKPVPTEDSMGRYFVQLEGEDAAVPALEVRLVTPSGREYGARLSLNRVFLEAGLQARQIHTSAKQEYSFSFRGRLDDSTHLEFPGHPITRAQGEAEVSLRLKAGRNVVPGELRSTRGPKRILNLALQVTETRHDPAEPVLSFNPPDGAAGELVFAGVTNPGARLSAQGQEIAAASDGAFRWSYRPGATRGVVKFEVSREGLPPRTFSYAFECPACVPAGAASTARRRSLGIRVSELASYVFTGDSIPGKVLTSYSGPLDPSHVSLQYYHGLSQSLFGIAALSLARAYDGDSSDQVRLRVENQTALALGLALELTPRGLFGASLRYTQARLSGAGFTPSPDRLSHFGLDLFFEGAFALSERWLYAPRLGLGVSGLSVFKNESPSPWLFASLQLLGLRYMF
ncbi:MAG TPA: hypothetical protein VFV50_03315 [Bdellovibrionales bacterium]|nr:hypothetical protein [Bdellovibrionales bacterium]